ncbi:MAG: PHP domain-containing protein [Deltaproteobacteria bacterium]|nr:PHP domain-containing protein [Deltaproteobacteria bacterium]
MLIDLHVRTPFEEGDPDVETLLRACAKAGLDGLCLVGDGEAPSLEEARQCPEAESLALFFGLEVQVEDGYLIWIPENPAVFESDDWMEDGEPPRTMDGISSLAESRGGVIIAVHPYDRSREPLFRDAVYDLGRVDAIEIANANLARTPNNLAIEAAVKMKRSSVGGTGPMRGPGSIGRSATVFLDDVKEQADLVAAVARGDVWAVDFLDRLDGPRGRGGSQGRGRNRRSRSGGNDRGPRERRD